MFTCSHLLFDINWVIVQLIDFRRCWKSTKAPTFYAVAVVAAVIIIIVVVVVAISLGTWWKKNCSAVNAISSSSFKLYSLLLHFSRHEFICIYLTIASFVDKSCSRICSCCFLSLIRYRPFDFISLSLPFTHTNPNPNERITNPFQLLLLLLLILMLMLMFLLAVNTIFSHCCQ